MDILVDSSALIAVVTNEPTRPQIIALTKGATLIAPASVPWEIGNAFSAMLKRKRATIDQMHQAWAAYQQIPIRLVPVDIAQALTIAKTYDIYAYDAYFIMCGMRHKCMFLTLDSGLRHAARQAGIITMEVAS